MIATVSIVQRFAAYLRVAYVLRHFSTLLNKTCAHMRERVKLQCRHMQCKQGRKGTESERK